MKYSIGMYGGKFMPLHKGHNYCIETASKECEIVYVILFYGGVDEEKILNENNDDYLSFEERKKHVINICKKYNNTIPTFIDVSNLRLPDGSEDWDAETPLVRNVVVKYHMMIILKELILKQYIELLIMKEYIIQ